MLNTSQSQDGSENGIDDLKLEVAYRTQLQEIGNKINSARDLEGGRPWAEG